MATTFGKLDNISSHLLGLYIYLAIPEEDKQGPRPYALGHFWDRVASSASFLDFFEEHVLKRISWSCFTAHLDITCQKVGLSPGMRRLATQRAQNYFSEHPYVVYTAIAFASMPDWPYQWFCRSCGNVLKPPEHCIHH